MIISTSGKTILLGASLLASILSFGASAQSLHAKIGAYPGTKTTVTGAVTVNFDQQDLTVKYNLKGLNPVRNGGLHIHVGTSCKNADKVGGHYFAPKSMGDYWKSGQWVSDTKGRAKGSFRLVSGLAYKANIGHAIVVHNASGARIGCGILEK
ncbi:superoxide dismutase family protein [Celerinatantimonas yamalensis]|uniref:Superoxide dismutase family protein n=1 Tax=Celerinatantimonas yamalensis TaxID=559956 RepID=A0ABW9G464_9GAMM